MEPVLNLCIRDSVTNPMAMVSFDRGHVICESVETPDSRLKIISIEMGGSGKPHGFWLPGLNNISELAVALIVSCCGC